MAPEVLTGKDVEAGTIQVHRPVTGGWTGDLEHRSDDSTQIHFRHSVGPFFYSLLGQVKLENPLPPAEKEGFMILLTGMLNGQIPRAIKEQPTLSFKATELIGVQYQQEDGQQWYWLRFANQVAVNNAFFLLLPWVNLSEGKQSDLVNNLTNILLALGMLDEPTVNELKHRIPPGHWQNMYDASTILNKIQLEL